MNGWSGQLLRVNLSTGQSSVESSEKYFDYIGGKGMATRIIYDEVPNGTEPTAVESKIVMAVGPNTGTSSPCSGRTTFSFLSPFTKYNAIVDAHVGGDTAVMLKGCGFDAMIVEGESDTPVYINVHNGKVTVEDASDLWGKTTTETTAMICEKHGAGVNVLAIGQAGENLLNLSCVLSGVAHSAGGGLGKLFGAKKLKAIALYGSEPTLVADPQRILDLNNHVMSDLMGANNNHVVPTVPQSWSQYSNKSTRWTGHPGLTWGAAPGGPIDTGESAPGQPTLMGYRTQKAVFDHGAIAEKYTVKMVGCTTCPVRCYGALDIPHLAKYGRNTTHANTCLGNRPYVGLMKNFKDFEDEGDGKLTAGVYSAILADDYGLWDNYGELRAT
ncbi:MAG: aldehyde ferredoxin oxidoreductase, partial [Clostridiales bacterium]|nr:aldehyde ferredoxin oxidoreductase [Clostridiales bacterium]